MRVSAKLQARIQNVRRLIPVPSNAKVVFLTAPSKCHESIQLRHNSVLPNASQIINQGLSSHSTRHKPILIFGRQ
jgi:hypothetical protein